MLKKLACLLALIASPLFAQQTPQAIPLTSGACKLDGTVGCGAGGGGGSGTVTSVAISGGTTGFSFSGSPITTSGTFTLSGTLAIANGGTNLTTYTLGDTLYSSAANTLAKLAGNTTTTKKFLMQVGNGAVSAAPSWTATAADFPTLNQSTTGNAATATALAADPTDCGAATYATSIAASGNLGCSAVPAMVGDSGAGGTAGLVPAPAIGDSAKFLKGDGTWAAGGGGDALTANPLSQFAPTTSAQLAGVISNETGSGLLPFATEPTLTSPTITKGTPAYAAAFTGGHVGIGTVTPGYSDPTAGRTILTLEGSSDTGVLELATAAADADGNVLGVIQFTDKNSIAADKRITSIGGLLSGSTATNRGGALRFFTKPDGASGMVERARFTDAGVFNVKGPVQQFTATQAAASQAGVGLTVAADPAVAGSSVAGAASGGLLTLQAGDSKRLTSGNADALGVQVNTGAGIGTGKPGWLNVWFGGPSVTTAKHRWQGDSVSIVLNGVSDWDLSGTQRATILGIGSGSYTGAPTDATLVGYRIGVSGSETGAVRMGNNIHSGYASNDTGGLSATTSQSSNSVMIGFDSGAAAAAARAVALGYRARVNAADTGVVGGIGFLSWQIGSNSNTPVTRTFRSPSSRGGTDSNVAGSSLNIAAGEGTGTAGGGSVRIQTAPAGSTGTTANTLADRRVFAAKQVTLTESTATLVLNVGVASGTVAGGVFSYTIRADDGTDFQVIRGDVPWSAVNKAGTITATLGTPIEVTTTSTGTLTNTTTAVVNGNTIDFKLNAVSSLTQTTLHAYVSGTLDGTGVFTTQ